MTLKTRKGGSCNTKQHNKDITMLEKDIENNVIPLPNMIKKVITDLKRRNTKLDSECDDLEYKYDMEHIQNIKLNAENEQLQRKLKRDDSLLEQSMGEDINILKKRIIESEEICQQLAAKLIRPELHFTTIGKPGRKRLKMNIIGYRDLNDKIYRLKREAIEALIREKQWLKKKN